jgi:hypothetical protein
MSSGLQRVSGRVFMDDRGTPQIAWDGDQPPPDQPGVYELSAPHPLPRIRGESATLYVGRSSDVGHRTAQIGALTHGISDRLARIFDGGARFWPEGGPRELRITAERVDDPELDELRRLHRFERAHGELPPLNRSSAGDPRLFLIRRVATALVELLHTVNGFGARSLRVSEVRHDEAEQITYANISYRRVVRAQVAWAWPRGAGEADWPEWWPAERRAAAEALHLFVVEAWGPVGLGASRWSEPWPRVRSEETPGWLMHTRSIPLAAARLDAVPDHELSRWSLEALTKDLPSVAGEPTITAALARAWAHLHPRIAPPRAAQP